MKTILESKDIREKERTNEGRKVRNNTREGKNLALFKLELLIAKLALLT